MLRFSPRPTTSPLLRAALIAAGAGVVAAAAWRSHLRRQAWRRRKFAQDLAGGTLDSVCQGIAPAAPVTAALLPDNTDAWVARWRLVHEAKERIDFSTFIIGGDAFGMALMGALLRKQEAGVRVRLLVDSFGFRFGAHVSLGLKPLKALRAAGADIRLYNVLSWRHVPLLVKRKSLMPLFACDHDKLLLVDGEAGITGGRNISSDYFAHVDDDEKCFSDRDVLLRGEACVRAMTAALERERCASATHALRTRHLKLAVRRLLLAAAEMMDRWLAAPPYPDDVLALLDTDEVARKALEDDLYDEICALAPPEDKNDKGQRTLARSLAAHPRTRGAGRRPEPPAHDANVCVLDTRSALGGEDQRMNKALLRLLAGAKESVVIESPYLMLSERALIALEAAAHRGVQITIVTNGPTSTDNAPAEAFFLATWRRLLARVKTLRLFVLKGTHNGHGKTAVIDGRVAIVGSYNLDIVSAALNGEVAVVLRGDRVVDGVATPIAERLTQDPPCVVEYRIDKRQLKRGRVVALTGPEAHVPLQKRLLFAVLSRVASLLSFFPGIGRP